LVEVNGEILSAKWNHIVEVYFNDAAWSELRTLHKITDMHVMPDRIQKMSNAIQVLSHYMVSTIALLVNSGNF
jgi:hypothetical protein